LAKLQQKARSRPKFAAEMKLYSNWMQELVYAAETGNIENMNAVSEELKRMYQEALEYAGR
jgi:hypothetical protein